MVMDHDHPGLVYECRRGLRWLFGKRRLSYWQELLPQGYISSKTTTGVSAEEPKVKLKLWNTWRWRDILKPWRSGEKGMWVCGLVYCSDKHKVFGSERKNHIMSKYHDRYQQDSYWWICGTKGSSVPAVEYGWAFRRKFEKLNEMLPNTRDTCSLVLGLIYSLIINKWTCDEY